MYSLSLIHIFNRAHTRRIGGISPFSFSWMCADSVSCLFSSVIKVGYRDRKDVYKRQAYIYADVVVIILMRFTLVKAVCWVLSAR